MTKLRVTPTCAGGIVLLFVAALSAGNARLVAAPAAPTMNPAVVLGPNVTLSWTSVPGATSYRLAAGAAPGQTTLSTNVGNVTQIAVSAPFPGTYYARIFAIDSTGESPSSIDVPIVVTSMFVPPAAPTNMAAFANGRAAVITWDLGTGGGTPTTLLLHAGTTPGASDAGIFPVAVGTQLAAPSVNPGNYYLRVQAVNQGGQSGFSNEVNFNMPVGGACSAPPARVFTPTVFGRYVQFGWQGVPGAAGYRLDFSTSPGGPTTASLPFGPGTTSYAVTGAPLGVYYGTLVTAFSCGQQTAGPQVAVTIDGSAPPGPRTPNPAPGQRLPLPNRFNVVQRVAARFPTELRLSCPSEHRGESNRFLYELVRELRREDNRWGLNWKRGNRGDMSQDIVTYNYSSDPDEDTTNVYIIDVVAGHCGSNPGPFWLDQTEATRAGGTIGRWTLLPFIQAGYPIVSDEPQR